ncbi:MAG: TetR/AcrR family transcriptional regulator [Candidatus Symbiothrix sp.]|jgi:AcrR family transcriptional regulator|nr:TetR/AcrR family transcriptional regulator [Candidatus Symbiothrix sp.]
MAIAVAQTREKLIDVARRLFARIGVENTTMNDIAVASKKGRRTLYTYFNSKTEIYNAVVESELNLLYNSLDTVVQTDIPADEKLIEFITLRLETIRSVVFRNGTLKADFFRDIWRVANVRKELDCREIDYLKTILDEGVKTQVFEIEDTDAMANILHHALKGLEVPYVRGIMKGLSPFDKQGEREHITKLLFYGIKKK